MSEPLGEGTDNVLLWRLADVVCKAGDPKLKGVGDPIDRGLITLKLLDRAGFELHKKIKK